MKRTAIVVAMILASSALHAQVTSEQLAAAAENPATITVALDAAGTAAQRTEAIVATIRLIEESELSAAMKTRRVALLVAESIVWLHPGSLNLVGDIATGAGEEWLPTITAATVYAAAHRSPEVLEAILEAEGDTEADRGLINDAARNPVAILGAGTVSILPTIPPPLAPDVALEATREGHARDIIDITVCEPRPPARKYRGQ